MPFGTVSMNENWAGLLKGRMRRHISMPPRLNPSGSYTLIPSSIYSSYCLQKKTATFVLGLSELEIFSLFSKPAVS